MAECVRCRTDNPAAARFCMSCGDAIALACEQCGQALPAEARFCAFCGTSVRDRSGPPSEMIKLVTILFADVVGSTAQAEAMHPEDTRALMAEFFDAMSEEIRAEGGTVERIIGDAIMADFGVPVAREDDPVRAVRAAWRMLQRVEKFNADRDTGTQVQIRIGINTGVVSTGGSFGEQLLVMGDAVNVAARLEQAAAPGTILVGERTARGVRDHYRLREHEPIAAKGKSDLVPAFVVEAELESIEEDAAAMTTPLVGRQAEMKKLQDLFSSVALDHSPHLVTLIGDPGVGKSRLVREFLVHAAGKTKVLFGRCLPYGDGVTLWPLREIIRAEAAFLSTDTTDEVRSRITSFAEVVSSGESEPRDVLIKACFATIGLEERQDASPTDPRETFKHLLDGWRFLLSRYASEQPVVVVIEDTHWADKTLLDVLANLVRHVAGPVIFICPARPDLVDGHPDWIAGLPNYSSIHLNPLDHEESCRFMSLLFALEELPEELTEKILDRAEGNPFFLEEILNRLIDEGYFALHDGRWEVVRDVSDVEVPDNVQTAILGRLDLLLPQDRNLLQLAAVVGRTFRTQLLEELADRDDLEASLARLARRSLIAEVQSTSLSEDREFGFKHVLTRDVAYDSLPRRRRGEAHATIGRWIETTRGSRAGEVAELIAHHYDRAYQWLGDDALRVRARSYFLLGSRNAVLRFAVEQAEGLGRRALDLSRPGAERVEALEGIGDVYTLSSSGDEAWAAFTGALNLLDDQGDPDQAVIARIASKAAIVATRWQPTMDEPVPVEDVRGIVIKGLAAAGDADSPERALLLVSRSYLQRSSETEEEEVLKEAETALEVAERLGIPELISAAIDGLSMCLLPAARYGEILRIQKRRVALAPELSDVREICDAYGSAGWSSVFVGHYGDAERFVTAAIERSRGIDPAEYLHALFWRTQARFMAGDWDGALNDQAEIERIEGDGISRMPSTFALRGYAVASLIWELRDDRRRRDTYLRILQTLRSESGDEGVAGARALWARALAHMGRIDEACELLSLERSAYLAGQLEAACEVAALANEETYTGEVLSLAEHEIERGELVALRHFTERLRGRAAVAAGDSEEAVRLLARSREGFARLGSGWEEAWSCLLLAEVLATKSDKDAAAFHARTSLATFRELRSVSEIERARRLIGS